MDGMDYMDMMDGRPVASVPVECRNARLFSSPTAEADSPFAGLGYESDQWKAFIEFEICHALPNVIGPVQEGNYVGYTAEALAASHARLRFQQVNLRHMLKAYDPKNITRDRIIGCVVATHFPKVRAGYSDSGWRPSPSAKEAPAIRALAVVFKLAEGVPSLLGRHLASREKQSVSIEAITTYDNIGLWRASQPDVVVPLLDPGELESAIGKSPSGGLLVGKDSKGEQVVMIYGIKGPVDFRGVGVTPRPAESTAKIVSVQAEHGDLCAMAAEAVDTLAIGQQMRFRTGAVGIVREIVTTGIAKGEAGVRMAASPDKPVLRVEIPAGLGRRRWVLKKR
jgi:hypothetical protein